jgi:tellurite resistance protein TehA-like permease
VQLLPIAATVVASATGARVAGIVSNPDTAFSMLVTCYVLWGMSLPFAFIIFTLYYQRLVIHNLPPREVIVSALLPLGPCGYGATILILLGKLSLSLFPTIGGPLANSGGILYIAGLFVGIILWSLGLLWFFFAIAAIQRAGRLPFNMGWWGFTFPLGVYSGATLEIGLELETEFFKILGTVSVHAQDMSLMPVNP